MEHQDSGDTGSYDKKKNEDDEAEATLPPTDGTTVPIRPRSVWEETIRLALEEMIRLAPEEAIGELSGGYKAMLERSKSKSFLGLGGVVILDTQTYVSLIQGMTSRDKECITCKWQCPRNNRFCACHRKLTPIIDRHKFQLKSSPAKVRPGSSSLLPEPTRSNLSGGGTSTMHSHGSSGEVIGFAHEDGYIEMGHSMSMGGMPSSDRVQGGLTLVLRGDSSPNGFADEDSDVEMRGTHSSDGVQGGPTLVLRGDSSSMGGTTSSDCVQGGLTLVLRGDSSSHGFADEDSDVEMTGTHSSYGVQGGPTLVLRGDSSSMGGTTSSDCVQGGLTLVLRGDSSSHGFADEDSDVEMTGTHSSYGVQGGPTLVLQGYSSSMGGTPSDRVQGGPTLVLRGDSSSHGFADEDSDVEMTGTHSSDGVQGGPTLVLQGYSSSMGGTPSDRVQGGPTLVLRGDSSSHGFADEDSDVRMRGTHSSDGVQGGPTLVLRGDSSSMGGTPSSDRVQGGPTLVLRGDSSSHGFAHEESDIEMGGTHSSDGVQDGPTLVLRGNSLSVGGTPSSDRVQGGPRLVDPGSYHLAHEDTWQRLPTMVDPLLGVNVQGACSLVAYKSSDGSSPAKDVLLYLLVFVYVLGFLSALGGKLYRSSRMQVIGLLAAALGFLMTMALVVIYKI